MYKIEFTLKQHTPLIHFQNDEGATLRATELKPKLDQFLIELFLNERGEEFEYAHEARTKFLSIVKSEHKYDWIKGGIKADENKIALDYKVNITAKNAISTKIEANQQVPMFFGNMGNDYNQNPKYFSFSESVTIYFTTQSDFIKDQIESHFKLFILTHNFGTRQNKGYGSFVVEGSEAEINKIKVPKLNFSLKNDDEIQGKIFKVINYYYQRLKSGINYSNIRDENESYKHSFLKMYVSNNTDYKWEKPWMKNTFFSQIDRNFNPIETGKMSFARALLGLYPSVKFIKDNGRNTNKQYKPERTINIVINENKNEIARIKSPITFKPIILSSNQRNLLIVVLIIINENYFDPLKNREFTFSSKNLIDGSINIPSKAIDIEQLINQYNNIELKSHFSAYEFSGKICEVTIS